jgi:gamma-tubulin complex component 4
MFNCLPFCSVFLLTKNIFYFQNFQGQSNLLFKILSSVRSHNASPHLAQLLLRLDFNRYFSIAGGLLGRYD